MKCCPKIRIYTKDEKEVGFRKRELHPGREAKGRARSISVWCVQSTAWPDRSKKLRDAQSNVSKNKEKLMLWTGWEIKVNGIGELENTQ